MLFQFGFYSSLLLIFFVHGLVYSVLLCRKGIINESRPDKWLALFLLLCSLFIAPWMIGFAGWYDAQPYRDILFYTPFQQLYFIGPVVFFYIQSLLNPSFRFGRREWLHLLPGILYLLWNIVVVITDKVLLKRYYLMNGWSDPDFDTWYQATGLFSMLFYLAVSLRYYLLYKKVIVQVVSYAGNVLFRWVRNFLIAFLLMLVLRIASSLFAKFIPALNNYMQDWWFYFGFALIFYYIAINGYASSIEIKVPFKLNLLGYKPVLLLQPAMENNLVTEEAEILEIDNAPSSVTANRELIDNWKPKIISLLQQEKIYEDAELTLTQMARRLKTNSSLLSKIINQGFGQNFNDFINQYRIEAVKEKLKNGEQQRQTLLGIAFDCGFNSKATFNRAFKKVTGQSPKEFLGQLN
jgi:AraC-like DNA-binding protein